MAKFKQPSEMQFTGWRTTRYREIAKGFNAKEEDHAWQLIEDFIANDPEDHENQLRFFKALEKFTKAVHVERLRFKQMKELELDKLQTRYLQIAYRRYDVTYKEFMRKWKLPPVKVQKARKFVFLGLYINEGKSYYRISKMFHLNYATVQKWSKYDVDIDE